MSAGVESVDVHVQQDSEKDYSSSKKRLLTMWRCPGVCKSTATEMSSSTNPRPDMCRSERPAESSSDITSQRMPLSHPWISIKESGPHLTILVPLR